MISAPFFMGEMRMYRMSVINNGDVKFNEEELKKMLEYKTDFQLVSTVGMEEALYEVKENDIEVVFAVLSDCRHENKRMLEKLISECRYTYFVLAFTNYNCTNLRCAFRLGAFDCISYPMSETDIRKVYDRIENSYMSRFITDVMMKNMEALIDNIFIGGGNEELIIKDILDGIYMDARKSLTEKQLLVENVKEKIYMNMIYRKPWVEKFIWDQCFMCKTDFHVKDRKFVEREWIDDFMNVSKVIRKYQMLDNKLIYNIGKYIVVHVDERMSLDDLSQSVYLNKSYISHIFKKVSGLSLTEFMVDVKIDRAKILLLDSERKIYEIAEQIGYNDVEYFRKKFKDSTGLSPTEYRKKLNILGASA